MEEELKKITSLLERIVVLLEEKKPPKDVSKDELIIEPYKKCILVTGNTIKYKTFLKKEGGKYNSTLKGWIFTQEKGKNIKELIQENFPSLVVK